MERLSPKEKHILELLLGEGQSSDELTSAKRFRVDNYSDLGVIEALVSRRLIIESNGRYRVSVLALSDLESADAKGLMIKAERLWQAYREQYKQNLEEMVVLSVVAKHAGIDVDSASRTLVYMMEVPWYSGSQSSAERLYEAVGPREIVLKYETFSAYLDEVRAWGGTPHGVPIALDSLLVNKSLSTRLESKPLPSWIDKLPEHACSLLKEVYVAESQGLMTLAAMGVRGVIDAVCWDVLGGDYGNFPTKLKKLLDERHLSPAQHEALTAVVAAGNAASHQGYTPDLESLQTMIQALQHMLESIYVLEISAQSLRDKTPERRK